MSEPGCTCSIKVDVSWVEPGQIKSITVQGFQFCPLHAAAPDLLAALERMLHTDCVIGCFGDAQGDGCDCGRKTQATLAIAKAKLPA